ncbi:methylosome protein WDR77-like [Haliotis asinina]|uniref:methylosome protein WDR77-like n=1 Tax=Haliotis asinina TaxID=109174 RepID=UPI0035320780
MDQIPAAMDRQLDVVQCHRDGGLLLGASSLSGRYWLGSLWFYSNPALAPDVEKCTAGVQLEAGLQDATWADAATVVVGLDTGGVAVWGLVDDFHTFVLSQCAIEHDNIVSSISVSADGKTVISASYDNRIKVWDLSNLSSIHTYRAHSDIVWSVDCHPTEADMYLSCGHDKTVLLWDQRKPRPASIIKCPRLQGAPTCSSWQPGSQHTAAIGSEVGQMVLMDIRMVADTVRAYTPHTRRVQRAEFCPAKPSLLASVGEDCGTVVAAVDDDSIASSYSVCSHSDFVQGLTWFGGDCLYTCGWDSQVVRHDLNDSKSNTTKAVVMDVNGEIPDKGQLIEDQQQS